MRNARLAVLCATGALTAAGIVAFSTFATEDTDGDSANLAAAGVRLPDDAATRGAPRSPLEQVPGVQSPVDEAQPATTTTAAPVTTSTTAAAPSTTEPPATTAPTTAKPKPAAAPSGGSNTQSGKASYYDYKAGGCAHKTIAKGTKVTVTNTASGKSATCVVNDRGPFVAGRIIDLDTTVFKQIASTSAGVASVKISW